MNIYIYIWHNVGNLFNIAAISSLIKMKLQYAPNEYFLSGCFISEIFSLVKKVKKMPIQIYVSSQRFRCFT